MVGDATQSFCPEFRAASQTITQTVLVKKNGIHCTKFIPKSILRDRFLGISNYKYA